MSFFFIFHGLKKKKRSEGGAQCCLTSVIEGMGAFNAFNIGYGPPIFSPHNDFTLYRINAQFICSIPSSSDITNRHWN
jgi:hypothetical protein